MKKIDPTKNVQATVVADARSKYHGIDPSAKHTEPMPNSAPMATLAPLGRCGAPEDRFMRTVPSVLVAAPTCRSPVRHSPAPAHAVNSRNG